MKMVMHVHEEGGRQRACGRLVAMKMVMHVHDGGGRQRACGRFVAMKMMPSYLSISLRSSDISDDPPWPATV